jgi:hypothetical protein
MSKLPIEVWSKNVLRRLADGAWSATRVFDVTLGTEGIPQEGDPHPFCDDLKAHKPKPVEKEYTLRTKFFPKPDMMRVDYSMAPRLRYPIAEALAAHGL